MLLLYIIVVVSVVVVVVVAVFFSVAFLALTKGMSSAMSISLTHARKIKQSNHRNIFSATSVHNIPILGQLWLLLLSMKQNRKCHMSHQVSISMFVLA